MFKKIRLTITALLCATAAFSQSGAIKVHMFDKDKKEGIPFANVVVLKGPAQIGAGVTDIDGYVIIKPIDAGEYTVKGVYVGYVDQEITNVTVSADRTNYVEMPMPSTATNLGTVTITKQAVDILPKDTHTGITIGAKELRDLPEKDINSVVAQSPGTYSSDVGGAINMRGARSDATEYIVDGMKISAGMSTGGLPQLMIGEITTITGGVPAKYGDATGGIVEINTIGASPVFFGSVQGLTSELLDPWGYNDGNFTIGGPIFSKMDTSSHTKQPIVDFIVGGEYTHQKDNDPTFVGQYTANADTLAGLQKNPYRINPLGGYQQSSAYLTADQMTHTKYHLNDPQQLISLNGKIGIHVSNNVNIVVGGSYYNQTQNDYQQSNEMFDDNQNPLDITNNYKVYVRFTQRFPTPEGKDKQSVVKNAFYTIQAEYGNNYQIIENSEFKDNLFEYGYIGKFEQYYSNVYQLKYGKKGLAFYQTAFNDSSYTFDPTGSPNPLEANYTSQMYKLLGQQNVTSANPLLQNEALLNGFEPVSVYSMWSNTGSTYNLYRKENQNHLRFTANFSADIKNHALQIGFEYEQTVLSFYAIEPVGLWGIMRQNADYHLQQLDTTNPILVSQGTYNTYSYNRAYDGATQTQFDKSMRQKLGLPINGSDYIQPDNYAPSFYSLDMFSATDLINNGNSPINYFGYNYLGNGPYNTTSLDDFFNATDANGNHTYPIAPYHPIYIAGYIQDHFDIKSLKFDIGLRVDRFDANQPVLADPYLFFPAKKVSELPSTQFNKTEIPGNMGSNYVVYVNDAQSPTAIVGYRNGNTWYNAQGNAVPDPTVLAAATTTGTIQPYLENPNQTNLSSNAFTTYTPQVNLMPRIAFAFPISDVAKFFAHYDILTERPPGVGYNIFNPLDYVYIQNKIGQTIENPALQPQQTTDYELGYTQVLNEQRSAALTLSAFYRENRNEVQAYRYFDAYPATYLAFNNIDFGTTKGLTLVYDLRGLNNIKLRASYTLQFANGTGSGPSSGENLAASGQPNLQIPQPLANDQRHTFLINVDFHYASGEAYNGPVFTSKSGKSTQILANAGFNCSLTLGSGTPYTKQASVTEGDPDGNVAGGIQQKYNLVGSINGSNLPWTYRVDLRVDKDFPLILSKSKGDKAKHCDILAFVEITNLLNTENVKTVYNYTGSATDDGFLTSLQGQTFIPQQTDPQAFQDQYKIKVQDPGYLSIPRQARIGVQFNF